MIIKPKFRWRDEFLIPKNTVELVTGVKQLPGPGKMTIVNSETALAIIPKVGTALATHTGVTFGGSNNRCCYDASGALTAWADFPTGFDMSEYADQGLMLVMFDSAGVGAFCFLGGAGSGETLGSDLLAGWDFTSGWAKAVGTETIIDNNSFSVPITTSAYGLYTPRYGLTGAGKLYRGNIVSSVSAGNKPSLRGYNPAIIYATDSTIEYNVADSNGAAYVYRTSQGVEATFDVTTLELKQVLTPSATGCYAYKDATMTTSGWNKPSSFNMNSATYTFGIYEPQSRGRLFFMGGKSTPAYGDPGYWKTEAVTRKRGLVCCWKVNLNSVAAVQILFGFDTNQAGTPGANAFFVSSGTLRTYDNSAQSGVIFTPVAATDTYLAIVLRDSGAHFYAKIGTANWKYLWSTTVNNTATLYAGISNYNAVGYCDWIRQSNYLWMQKPLISDSFAGADGSADGRVSNGLGHAETTGLGSGGSGVVWAGSTATVATNRLVITPTLGAEIATGNTVVGSWYSITATEADHFFTGCAVGNTFHCTTAKSLDANNKVKEITLSSCWYVAALDTADVTLSVKFIMSGVNQCGIVMALDDAGNNFVLLYRDGLGSVTLKIFESGTTYTAKASTAIAYSADTELSLRRDATGIWGYYNNGLVGSGPTTTLSAGENTNLRGLKIGCFSTAATNSFSSAVVQHTGTNGEIDILSRLIGA